MKINEIKINSSNPRFIKDERFEKLCNSIEKFPKMMQLRPIIIDNNNVILGGNMRYQAIKHLGYKEIPDPWIKQASELTEEEKKEFIIKDNVGFGAWDYDILANEWDEKELNDWGLEINNFKIEEESNNEIKNEDVLNNLVKIIVLTDNDHCLNLIEEIKKLKHVENVQINE